MPDDEKLQQRAAEIATMFSAKGWLARLISTAQMLRAKKISIHLETDRRAYTLDLYYRTKDADFTLYCAQGDEELGSAFEQLRTQWPTMKIPPFAKPLSPNVLKVSELALRAVDQLRLVSKQHGVFIDESKVGGTNNSGQLTIVVHWNGQSTKATVSVRDSQDVHFAVFRDTASDFAALLEDLWAISRTKRAAESTLSRLGGVLAELAPYRDCRLDLLPLLMPLRAAAPDQELTDEPYRFEFDKLEAKYREITENKK